MPVFHQMFANSGRPSLLQNFAESVVYTPTYGAKRVINAVVIREAWETNDSGKETPLLEIHVANDATSGMTEPKPGLEFIEVALRVGQTPTKRTITRIISHDEGMFVLECR